MVSLLRMAFLTERSVSYKKNTAHKTELTCDALFFELSFTDVRKQIEYRKRTEHFVLDPFYVQQNMNYRYGFKHSPFLLNLYVFFPIFNFPVTI